VACSNRFTRAGSSNRTRRRPSWSQGPSGTGSQTASGQLLFATGAQTGQDELTVIRTRGIFVVQVTAVAAIIDGYTGAAGICVVTENAFNAGIASIPTPVVDVAWDGWLWHQFFSIKAITATIGDGVNATALHQSFVIDSKAMRKTNITDVVV